MSMKKTITKKAIAKTIAFLLIFVLIYMFIASFLRMTDVVNIATIDGFYKEPENTIDVMLIGASEVYADYSATTAWKEYGYTSYSFGVSGVPGSVYKSMLRETLTRQKPKAVVFEVNGFLQNDAYYDRTIKLHSWIDNMHDEKNRMETINEIVPKDQRDSFYSTFGIYHNNWKDLGKCFKAFETRIHMKFSDTSYMKGFASFAKESDPSGCEKKKTLYFTDKSRQYMTDLLEYCKSCGIENVVFARFPHEKQVDNPEIFDEVNDLITSYGYNFVNFEDYKEEMGIESTYDYYNPEHLNVIGSRKLTYFLGKYLTENYDIKGSHSDKTVKRWDLCAQKTDKVLEECAKDTKNKIGAQYFELSAYSK